MNQCIIVIIALAVSALPTFAQTASERELQQLTEQHRKAITAATEPLVRRYQASLEQLLRRSTQAGDLDTALKIKDTLKALSGGGAASPVSDTAAKMPGAAPRQQSSHGPISSDWLNSITITRINGRVYWFASPNVMFTLKKQEQKDGLPPARFEYRITTPDSIEFTNGVEPTTFTFDKNRKKAAYVSSSKSDRDVGEVIAVKK